MHALRMVSLLLGLGALLPSCAEECDSSYVPHCEGNSLSSCQSVGGGADAVQPRTHRLQVTDCSAEGKVCREAEGVAACVFDEVCERDICRGGERVRCDEDLGRVLGTSPCTPGQRCVDPLNNPDAERPEVGVGCVQEPLQRCSESSCDGQGRAVTCDTDRGYVFQTAPCPEGRGCHQGRCVFLDQPCPSEDAAFCSSDEAGFYESCRGGYATWYVDCGERSCVERYSTEFGQPMARCE